MDDDMRRALEDRRDLMEARAAAVLEVALSSSAPWVAALSSNLAEDHRAPRWRRAASIVAAYRDRYGISDRSPLGAMPAGRNQRVDRARAESAWASSQSSQLNGSQRMVASELGRGMQPPVL